MLFNSIDFAVFLTVVFLLYWFAARTLRQKNILLLVSSYFFYACWDYRFLFLLMFSTLLDYFTGLKMADSSSVSRRKFWFWLSVIINLGFLGVFKYYNFFIESFVQLLGSAGIHVDYWTLNIILPVGISFYTFHGLSYVIDVYKNKIRPERNVVDYSLFVSFFPLLVAGPIERATHLLPQLKRDRDFDYANAIDGLRQVLWGLFKKIVIADRCAEYVNLIFGNPEAYSGSTLVIGAILFAFQIYCDFSGYSDIAIGTSRLFGIELLRNFAFPYFSRDIAEFWRRWHISLSSWFKDYVYIPLGGSQVSTLIQIRNTFIIFLISGFWHGANWTFIVWGALNAIYFLPLLLSRKNRSNIDIVAKNSFFPSLPDLAKMSLTFVLVTFAWIFFRSESLTFSFNYISRIFTASILQAPMVPKAVFALIFLMLSVEWIGRSRKHALEALALRQPLVIRWGLYYSIIGMILYFGGKEQTFIYFQF